VSEGRISVGNNELVTVREAMRGLSELVRQLEAGEVDKFILTRHGKMVAAFVPLAALHPNAQPEGLEGLERFDQRIGSVPVPVGVYVRLSDVLNVLKETPNAQPGE
jgi:antitoxin (DNA-binding transcriptional repressor) of toxin-antitoxin stability system